MVVNATLVAMVVHWNQKGKVVYHVSSGLQNPLTGYVLEDACLDYFSIHPRVLENGKTLQNRRPYLFKRFAYFRAYLILVYKLPLEVHNHMWFTNAHMPIQCSYDLVTHILSIISLIPPNRYCMQWAYYHVGYFQNIIISTTEDTVSWCSWSSCIHHMPSSKDGKIHFVLVFHKLLHFLSCHFG